MTVTLRDAAQVLRFPEGEPFLRHDRAGELTLEPGSITCGAGDAAEVVVDCSGCAVLPGFVDAHTHLPFAGWRAGEYEMKVTGVPYEEIARRGGGIRSSARSFAAASDEAVLAQARALADEMLQHGTTSFECKSGYGLSVAQEERALRLAAALAPASTTALLAHAVPDGFTADSWMDEIEGISLPDHV